MTTRKAAVAGSFYPRFKPDLLRALEDSFLDKAYGPGELPKLVKTDDRKIIGGISPHAGIRYSGAAAAHTYYNIFKEGVPDTFIILGTDHVGYNKVGLMKNGTWETPLGEFEIDSELSTKILTESDLIVEDDSAFIGFPFGREHNIEVQLPFIKYCSDLIDKQKQVQIIPIKVAIKNLKNLEKIGSDISRAIEMVGKETVIIASSDMTHKQPKNIADPKEDLQNMKSKDQAVIDAFNDFDIKKVYANAQKTSVCGPQTIVTLMFITKNLKALTTQILKYYTSYDKSTGGQGPCEYSVGYFSGIITK
ncbi:MAG: AmmeMemoRadiSam system protein B [Candidatus Lokiarchaeota archaeon]|nr:AmmeMemoRadiSam system protein B [Candidatus Lokiarchaeota archaeon]MBD3200548.1 AmmeMemoRadiSam system protein B [Candidatus Lokiarchaeota archaeon]